MANPRQRRKGRSSSHSSVKQSRRAGKKLRKHPPIKGPQLLQDAWDKKKTVRQNYEAMGLLHTMNPVAQGGAEKSAKSTTGPEPTSAPETMPSKAISSGRGKIIRDENGAVLRIELPEEPADAQSTDKGKDRASGVWGDAMDDSDEEADKMIPVHVSNWVHIGRRTPGQQANSDGLGIGLKEDGEGLITALEKLSSSGVKSPHRATAHEIVWLRSLVAIHGRDINAMARDIKRNVWQKTPGELRRAINKAGGFEKLETPR